MFIFYSFGYFVEGLDLLENRGLDIEGESVRSFISFSGVYFRGLFSKIFVVLGFRVEVGGIRD